jgi:hypothetical protein
MKRCPHVSALAFAVVVGLGPIAGLAGPEAPPVFEHEDGYRVTVMTYESRTEIDYEEREATYEVEFTCRFEAPEDLDIVCLLEELEIVEAIDDERDDINLPDSDRDDDRKYVAFQLGLAVVELKAKELTRPAYTVQRMTVLSEGIIARERREYDLPAIVTDDAIETPYDTMLRLSEMKIGRDHMAEVVIEYERETAPGSPLPEAIYAVDEDGNILGGGRWNDAAELFAAEGTFEAEFLVTDDADVAALRLVFLTEYEVVPIEVELTGVFQP